MRRRTSWILVIAVVATLGSGERAGAAPPNLLLVLADDWSWPHAGAYGDPTIRTPAFDRLSRRGALFRSAFASSPVCCPSRAALLTGRAPHTLGEAASQWSRFPDSVATYVDALEAAGWAVGCGGKGWGPGVVPEGARNPAGSAWPTFETFLEAAPSGASFAYWHGSRKPHRPYPRGAGTGSGKRLEDAPLPSFLPDAPEVRGDLLDYVVQVEAFDRELTTLVRVLDTHGRTDGTLIVATSDNGMPFPRAKANVYDAGSRVPLAILDPRAPDAGRLVGELAELSDLAPTFLAAAEIGPLPGMTGRDLGPLLEGEAHPLRDAVFLERERHAYARPQNLSYPVRAVRTEEHLYVRNLRPGRWPAGDPKSVRPPQEPFADVDSSPTKELLRTRGEEPAIVRFARLAFARRPPEELYDLSKDPEQLTDVSMDTGHAALRDSLRLRLATWMAATGDPRTAELPERWLEGDGPITSWDTLPSFEPALPPLAEDAP